MLPGEWTFWADQADAELSPPHAPLGPVQVISFNCSWELSGYGAAEAVLPIEGNSVSRADLLRFYSWRLWAFYDGEPVWAGLPTDLDDDGGAAVAVAFTELPGYLNRKQHANTVSRRNTEQTLIAAELAARLDNISVGIVTEPGPGFLRDRDYAYLESQSRGELLTNLAEVIDGPQFRAEYAMTDAGRPGCTLRIAYPRVGRESGLALIVPGTATGFRARWSGAVQRTRTFAVGELPENAPDNALRPVETVFRPQPGIPQIDMADDWPGTVLRSTLRERAQTAATIYAGPSLELSATVPVSDPPLHTYGVGDPVQVVIADLLMPAGLHAVGTLTHLDVSADDSTASWTIAITDPAPQPAGTLTARLRALESHQVGMFHHNLEGPPDLEDSQT